MNLLFSLAIKNVLAYKKRSIITLILIAVTTGLMIFSSSFMSGSHQTMITNGVEIYPGYIQITHKDYPESPGLENLIFDMESIHEIVSSVEGVGTMGVRFESFVLFSSGSKAVAGLFTGIEPSKEQYLSRIKKALVHGQYLNDGDLGTVIMGAELAKKLKVDVGDSLSFIGTGADYSFTADNIAVKGLFKTGLYDFDANTAFVSKKYMDTVMATENIASHIVVTPRDKEDSSNVTERLNHILPHKYKALDWRVRLSGLVQGMKIDSIFGYITLGLIFLVIFFVIMIYTFLNIFARVREFGILRAIGTTPTQVFMTLLLESIIVSSLGVIIGGILGGSASLYFNYNPIDYSGYEEQFKQYGLAASAMPADFSLIIICRDMLILYILSLLSTLYPIVKILGLKPVEAIKHV